MACTLFLFGSLPCPPPHAPLSLFGLLSMPVATYFNLKTALASPVPEGLTPAHGSLCKESVPVFWSLIGRTHEKRGMEPPLLPSSYSVWEAREAGGDCLCCTLSGSCLMRSGLHLHGWLLWFLCCSWKDSESHNSVSLSSPAILAQCLNRTHTTRKEKRKFPAS